MKSSKATKLTTTIVIIVGLILGFLFGIQFLIQGVENSLVAEHNKLFPNTTYLVASGCQNSGDAQSNTDCKTDTGTIDNKIASKIKPYGGTIAGNFTIIKKQNISILPRQNLFATFSRPIQSVNQTISYQQ